MDGHVEEKTDRRRLPFPWFALLGAWFVWSPPFGTTEPSVFPALAAEPGLVYCSQLVLVGTFVVSALVLAFAGAVLMAPQRRHALLWALSGATAVGMLLGSVPALGASPWLMIVGSALRGLASCYIVAAWVSSISELGPREAGIALLGALVCYAALGIGIPALAEASAPAGVAAMTALPLLSALGCERAATHARERLRPSRPPELTRAARALFVLENTAYGFAFGIMLGHFSRLGSPLLYASFGAFALFGAIAFALRRKEVDYQLAFRVYISSVAFLLLVGVLLPGAHTTATAFFEAGLWAVQIFFTFVIFIDVEFSTSKTPWRISGFSLAFAGIGILAGVALIPALPELSMEGRPLIVATLTAMVVLAASFLPNGAMKVRAWGFSSFVANESRETFLARRCGELAAEHQLTPRQLEILNLLALGYDNEAITESLVISPLTTKTHVRNIYGKLGVHNKEGLKRLVEEG